MPPSQAHLVRLLAAVGLTGGVIFLLYGARRRRRKLSHDVVERIVVHFNKDFPDAILFLSRYYGKLSMATAASLVSIDLDGMEISATAPHQTEPVQLRINYEKGGAQDVKGAQESIISMSKAASDKLGVPLKNDLAEAPEDPLTDMKYGFSREEMGKAKALGSVKHYTAHIFVLWGTPATWPKKVDEGDESLLPVALSKAVAARKGKTTQKVKVTAAGVMDGDEEGTLLVFPHEIVVKGVTVANADMVVEKLMLGPMVEGIVGVRTEQMLPKHHLFVCAHLRRDKRCGAIGPYLVSELSAAVKEKGLDCPVRPCSHVGGHNYAGNVLAFSRRQSPSGEVEGHWFGYVTPSSIPDLVDRHLIKGELLLSLWRGQMGVTPDDIEDIAKKMCADCDCEKK